MRLRLWLGLSGAICAGCLAPEPWALPEGDGIGTHLLITIDGASVQARAIELGGGAAISADPPAYLIGYRAAFEDTEVADGLIASPGEPHRPLPASNSVWRLDRAGIEPISFEALPDLVRTLSIRTLDSEACFSRGGCYVDSVERFCVPCPTPAAPAPPAPPRVGRRGGCERDDPLEALRCSMDPDIDRRACAVGIDPPSGCVDLDEHCDWSDLTLQGDAMAIIMGTGGPQLPGGARRIRSLDAALLAATSTTIILLDGDFPETITPKGRIVGSCPSRTTIRIQAQAGPARIEGATVIPTATIPTAARLSFARCRLLAPQLTIAGELDGHDVEVIIPDLRLASTARLTLERAVFTGRLASSGVVTLGDTHLTGEGVRSLDSSSTSITNSRLDIQGSTIAIGLVGGASVSASRVTIVGGHVSALWPTASTYLGLEDFGVHSEQSVGVYFEDRPISLLFEPNDPRAIGESKALPARCTGGIRGRVRMRRGVIADDGRQPFSGARLNCSSIDVADLWIDVEHSGNNLQLGWVEGSLDRLLLSSKGRLEADEDTDQRPGTALLLEPNQADGVIARTSVVTRDLTVLHRSTGVRLFGPISLTLSRAQILVSQFQGIELDPQAASVTVEDLQIRHSDPGGGTDGLGGVGMILKIDDSTVGAQIRVERFSVHDCLDAGIVVEAIRPELTLISGELSGNGVPIRVLEGGLDFHTVLMRVLVRP